VYVGRFDTGVKDLQAELKAAQAAGANVVFSYTVGPGERCHCQRPPGLEVECAAGGGLAFVFPVLY